MTKAETLASARRALHSELSHLLDVMLSPRSKASAVRAAAENVADRLAVCWEIKRDRHDAADEAAVTAMECAR